MPSVRRFTPLPSSVDPMLESQVRALRTHTPRITEVPVLGRVPRMVFALAELAKTQDPEQARLTLEDAQSMLEEIDDPRTLAEARFAIGGALLALAEPSARVMLEDAGTLFEELGDDDAVMRVDAALREAEAAIEESPRSFQAR